MKRTAALTALAALTVLTLSGAVRADLPTFMHFQGVLTDDEGLPVTDTLSMTFSIDSDTTVAAIWSDTDPAVSVINGFYEAYLDLAGLDFDVAYFLGISVEGAPLGPKKPLASVPYSMRSAMTKVIAGDGLDGTSDSMAVRLSIGNEAVTGAMIENGTITSSKIATDQVVFSVNGMTDGVTLAEGNNITITPGTGDSLTISASVTGGGTDDDWVVNGDDVYAQGSGNVGVGTSTPGEKLDVSGGNIRTSGQLISTVAPGTAPLVVGSNTMVAGLNADQLDGFEAAELAAAAHGHDGSDITSGIVGFTYLPVGTAANTVSEGDHGHDGGDITSGTVGFAYLPVGPGATQVAQGTHTHATADTDWLFSGDNIYRETGDVGIGTNSPGAKLEVNGDAIFKTTIKAKDATGLTIQDDGGNAGIYVEDGGQVGIGSSSPGASLEIEDDNAALMINSVSASTYDPRINFQLDGSTKFTIGVDDSDSDKFKIGETGVSSSTSITIDSDGNVGIGETAPDTKLNVKNTGTTGEVLKAYSATFTSGEMVTIETDGNLTAAYDAFDIKIGSASSGGTQFIECTRGTDAKFRVHADGDVTADGAITGGGADFAEMVRVASGAAAVEAGDVMVIDVSSGRSVVRSSEARSTLVAGVYSTEPGFVGSESEWDVPDQNGDGEAEEQTLESRKSEFDEIPLAMVGIVPCKVSAENGAIVPGDLLVTSSTVGHAMKDGAPAVGTVLGKALEALPSGPGTIKILVTLH